MEENRSGKDNAMTAWKKLLAALFCGMLLLSFAA
jgi:hypothetical protein